MVHRKQQDCDWPCGTSLITHTREARNLEVLRCGASAYDMLFLDLFAQNGETVLFVRSSIACTREDSLRGEEKKGCGLKGFGLLGDSDERAG